MGYYLSACAKMTGYYLSGVLFVRYPPITDLNFYKSGCLKTTVRDQFICCTTDQKLTRIFDELCCMKGEQIKCSHGFKRIEQSLGGMSRTMDQVVQAVNSSTDFIKTLAYKSIDMEARARRNNIIRGIAENRGENCFQLIRDFITNHLDLEPTNMYITRAHWLGRINPNRGHQSRPIKANFRDFCDFEMIMSNARTWETILY